MGVQVIPVVLDTHVLVSGLLFGGAPGRLVDLWKAERIRPVMSSEMVSEFLLVLAYPKFQLTERISITAYMSRSCLTCNGFKVRSGLFY